MRQDSSRNENILALFGTDKSVALKDEVSEDPTSIQRSHDEANKRLMTHVLQDVRRECQVSSHSMFLINQALW